jgi:hypothetical protein
MLHGVPACAHYTPSCIIIFSQTPDVTELRRRSSLPVNVWPTW